MISNVCISSTGAKTFANIALMGRKSLTCKFSFDIIFLIQTAVSLCHLRNEYTYNNQEGLCGLWIQTVILV